MSSDRIILVRNDGSTKNIGKDFKSYDFNTVDKCAQLFLGDEAQRYTLNVPRLGTNGAYDWDCNTVTLYAPSTPAAHETVLRFCHLGRVKSLEGYCFVVTADVVGGVVGVYDSVEALIEFIAGQPKEWADDLFIRVVPFNKEL